MSDRSALVLIVTPEETIATQDYFMKYKKLIIEEYHINDLLKTHPNVYENMLDDNLNWYEDELIKNVTYIILLIRNSAGWPESIDIQPLQKMNNSLYLTNTIINFPS